MSVRFDFQDRVVLVTGASGALGSAVVEAFQGAGATVCAVDLVDPDSDESLLSPKDNVAFYRGDLTDEADVERVLESILEDHGQLDHLCNVAGTWRGGSPIEETDLEEVSFLLAVNFQTAFLTTKHALPALRETGGTIVNVSARSSLEGGTGDGPYRVSKAGIRILTETTAEENIGDVRANCVMPSVIDTPMNREMMPDSDHDRWVDPADIARTFLWLSSDSAAVTSGAAVPVYGEA